jgi:hypothetical protein
MVLGLGLIQNCHKSDTHPKAVFRSSVTITMDKSDEDDETTLCVTISRSHDTRNSSWKQRREIANEMEQAMSRWAKVIESKRVEVVQRNAVASGFVENANCIDDECPLCFETIPEWQSDPFIKLERKSMKFICCGNVCCLLCIDRFDEAHANTEVLYGGRKRVHCPFCRSTQPRTKTEQLESILRNAEAGRAFAHYGLGQRFDEEWVDNREDLVAEQKAIHRLTLASEKRKIGAQYMLGCMWYSGLAKSNRNWNERAMELLPPAVRRGHATSQYICGTILSEQNSSNEDALIWSTLAAAQGQAGGQRQLGRILFICSVE